MRRLSLHREHAAVEPAPQIIYRWDLDKTYLKSEFESLREMMRIPFEKAEDKIAAPGVAALIRALRTEAIRREWEVRIFFISASPPQIARQIKKKLELDGVVYDGIVFKDQLQRIMRGKFRHLREHVGYKLTELLQARRADPPGASEYLFGDDWESDPIIYSIYADVLAGRLAAAELEEILRAVRVDAQLIARARLLAEELAQTDAVRRIFINLERRTPPASFRTFGRRLVPAFNYFQTAACLYEHGVLPPAAVAEVGRSLIVESSYTPARLANSLADIERRGHLGAKAAWSLRRFLREEELLPPRGRVARLRDWWQGVRARSRRTLDEVTAEPIDYLALVAHREAEAHRA